VVRATFGALATPADRPLETQFQTAVPRQLSAEGKLATGTAPTVNGWRWDGSRLLVSGVLKPDTNRPRLDARQISAIRASLLGKSRAEAEAILQGYVEQGIISGYVLPETDPLPSLMFLLDVRAE
jgi:hypothetical protein